MRIIRNATELDTDDIKKIYECALYGIEGIVEQYFKFEEYVEFCLKHKFSYVAIDDDVVCGVLLAYEVPDLMFGKILYRIIGCVSGVSKKGNWNRTFKYITNGCGKCGVSRNNIANMLLYECI